MPAQPIILPDSAPDQAQVSMSDDFENPEEARKHDIETESEARDLLDDADISRIQQETTDAQTKKFQSEEYEDRQPANADEPDPDDPASDSASDQEYSNTTQSAPRMRIKARKSATQQATIDQITLRCKVSQAGGHSETQVVADVPFRTCNRDCGDEIHFALKLGLTRSRVLLQLVTLCCRIIG